jgi:hypothetical protein
MALDRRFVSGALVAVTVVVAGASSLPALLLGPAASDEPFIAPGPSRVAEAPAVKPAPAPEAEPAPEAKPLAEAKPAAVPPAPPVAETKPEPGVISAPASLPTPAPAPAKPAAEAAGKAAPASVVAAAPTPALAKAEAFPPVQAPTTEPPRTIAIPQAAPPKKTVRTDDGERRKAARARPVRPAIYPMREFLAWRR